MNNDLNKKIEEILDRLCKDQAVSSLNYTRYNETIKNYASEIAKLCEEREKEAIKKFIEYFKYQVGIDYLEFLADHQKSVEEKEGE